MATKTKSKKKPVKQKKTAPKKKITPKPKSKAKKVTVKKTAPLRKPAPKKKPIPKKTKKKVSDGERSQNLEAIMFGRRERRPRSAGQSGDMQGLSRIAGADSESVEELLEEGNSFEAGIVQGIENAPDADSGGIKTRQVPEDDVPSEYWDED